MNESLLDVRVMRALEAADKAALPGFPCGPISDNWLRAFLPALEAEGLAIVPFEQIRCPIYGEAKSASECAICHGDIIKCPIYGDGERKRRDEAAKPCVECGRDRHGYRRPRCRYCDGTAE